MSDKSFFKPTHLYKEYIILDLIEKNKDITQRELAKQLGIAVSMVNMILDDLEKNHYLKRKKLTTKTVEYILTKQGFERRKVLNIAFLSNSLTVYKSAKENLIEFIDIFARKGFKNILLYGAGEVAEILLQTIKLDDEVSINVLAIIDDDTSKQGKSILDTKIINLNHINEFKFDGILISSYAHQEVILNKLLNKGISKIQILKFFD
jgi:DNA-binding MarR family transcriptional regulator